MPTLGFLKKKRTKESKDFNTPASPTSDLGSSITPTSSKTFDSITTSALSSQSTAPQTSQPEVTKAEDPMSLGAQGGMPPGPQISPSPNSPAISNLINPPQHDATAQSSAQPTPMDTQTSEMASANGGMTASTATTKTTTGASGIQTTTPIVRTTKGKYTLTDFSIQRTLGTGSFGRVHLVQSKHNQRFYAVKVLKKQQVVKMKQVEHTNDERKMLQQVKHPFLITLWGTFQDSKNLYMVMDFIEGGELFSLLRKSQVSGVVRLEWSS
jgi:protein kinase A